MKDDLDVANGDSLYSMTSSKKGAGNLSVHLNSTVVLHSPDAPAPEVCDTDTSVCQSLLPMTLHMSFWSWNTTATSLLTIFDTASVRRCVIPSNTSFSVLTKVFEFPDPCVSHENSDFSALNLSKFQIGDGIGLSNTPASLFIFTTRADISTSESSSIQYSRGSVSCTAASWLEPRSSVFNAMNANFFRPGMWADRSHS